MDIRWVLQIRGNQSKAFYVHRNKLSCLYHLNQECFRKKAESYKSNARRIWMLLGGLTPWLALLPTHILLWWQSSTGTAAVPDARAVSLKKIKDYSLVGLRVQYFPFPFFTRQLNFPFAAFRGLPICMYITTGDNFICLRHLLQSVLRAAKSNCFLWMLLSRFPLSNGQHGIQLYLIVSKIQF